MSEEGVNFAYRQGQPMRGSDFQIQQLCTCWHCSQRKYESSLVRSNIKGIARMDSHPLLLMFHRRCTILCSTWHRSQITMSLSVGFGTPGRTAVVACVENYGGCVCRAHICVWFQHFLTKGRHISPFRGPGTVTMNAICP